jgi:hypothetical protein
VTYHTGPTPTGVALGDLNKDGKIDLIVSNHGDGSTTNGNMQVFLGVGDGTFLPPFTFNTHIGPSTAAAGDFNGDGRPDLAVGNFFSDDVSVLINQTIPITSTGGISGTVFNDNNGNGTRDSGETSASGATVYIDSNKDGLLDNGEKSTTSDSSGNWSFTGLAAGSYRVRLKNAAGKQHTLPAQTANFYDVTVTAGGTATGKLFGVRTFTPSPAPKIAINAGGPSFINNNGVTWSADTGFTGGTAGSTVYDVGNTDNDPLFYAYRQGTSFTYTLAIANGTYSVSLLFADPTKTAAGQRKFSVKSQGTTVLSNFDIVAAAGAKKAITKTFNATVTNGKLTLQFTASVDQAIVSGIEVFPSA